MQQPRIALIIASIRTNRMGHKPAQWLHRLASQRSDLQVEIVDLKDYPLPLFDEVASNAYAPTQDPVGQRWQKKLAEFDGYVWITPEYNHAPPGAFKNALDFAFVEWNHKAVGFFGYGGVGAARAIEQLRLVAAELRMVSVVPSVHLAGADFLDVWQKGKDIATLTYLEETAHKMLNELVWWATVLKQARATGA